MNSTPPPRAPAFPRGFAPSWGHERADCRGDRALGFFIDDLHRVLSQHDDAREGGALALIPAQQAVDALLRRYVEIGASPAAFNGQTITLRQGADQMGVAQIVPVFSAGLKAALTTLLRRSPPADRRQ